MMSNDQQDQISQLPTPGLVRRLAAILYDGLLLLALLVVASALVTVPVGLIFGQPAAEGLGKNPLFILWLELVPLLFFTWFWQRGGQTIGMRAWRLRLVSHDGEPVTLGRAVLRFFTALLSWLPLGLGFLWVLVDPQRLAWHDHLSGTRLVVIPKN
jgi:uncharacterized RDD family membrane protein YckC